MGSVYAVRSHLFVTRPVTFTVALALHMGFLAGHQPGPFLMGYPGGHMALLPPWLSTRESQGGASFRGWVGSGARESNIAWFGHPYQQTPGGWSEGGWIKEAAVTRLTWRLWVLTSSRLLALREVAGQGTLRQGPIFNLALSLPLFPKIGVTALRRPSALKQDRGSLMRLRFSGERGRVGGIAGRRGRSENWPSTRRLSPLRGREKTESVLQLPLWGGGRELAFDWWSDAEPTKRPEQSTFVQQLQMGTLPRDSSWVRQQTEEDRPSSVVGPRAQPELSRGMGGQSHVERALTYAVSEKMILRSHLLSQFARALRSDRAWLHRFPASRDSGRRRRPTNAPEQLASRPSLAERESHNQRASAVHGGHRPLAVLPQRVKLGTPGGGLPQRSVANPRVPSRPPLSLLAAAAAPGAAPHGMRGLPPREIQLIWHVTPEASADSSVTPQGVEVSPPDPAPSAAIRSAAPAAAASPAIDVGRLADQVYGMIERKFKIERARRGL
jgi:hypothetical protein